MAITPSVIAESATLNAQKCQPPRTTSTKSTTEPSHSRSIRLPIAPPRISASPSRARRSCGRHARRVERDPDERRRRRQRDHGRLVRKVDGVQEAERRAGVADVREVQHAGDHGDAVVQRDVRAHQRLGDLVGGHDATRSGRTRSGADARTPVRRRRGASLTSPPPARPHSAGTRLRARAPESPPARSASSGRTSRRRRGPRRCGPRCRRSRR